MNERLLSVIIPCYNEERRVRKTLERLPAALSSVSDSWEIIFVDDQSKDKTAAIISYYIATVASHQKESVEKEEETVIGRSETIFLTHSRVGEKGKGGAVKRGVEMAGGDVILYTDVDLPISPDHIPAFLSALRENHIAIASRFLPESKLIINPSRLRSLVSNLGRAFTNLLLGLRVTDSQCGFKAFRGKAARELFADLRSFGYIFEIEILLRARARGMKIAEIPVACENRPESKINIIADSLSGLFSLIRLAVRRPK